MGGGLGGLGGLEDLGGLVGLGGFQEKANCPPLPPNLTYYILDLAASGW